jgi:hypothetical protein
MRKPSTEKTDDRILFSRIRDIALKMPYQSKMYRDWLKHEWSPGDLHHVCGSSENLKSTNLLAVIVPHKEHLEGGESIEWRMQQLPQAFLNLIDYVMFLEETIRELRREL